jgi:tryptophan-rich hypothetical protein
MVKPHINPGKLLRSKWTAVQPRNKEKHFLVTDIIRDENEVIVGCILEAVINHHCYEMAWQALQNTDVWRQGWQ